MKRRFLVIFIVLAALVVMAGLVSAGDKAPGPPVIQWQLIDIPGAEPAACSGQPGCAWECFYIRENSGAVYEFELDCEPAIINE